MPRRLAAVLLLLASASGARDARADIVVEAPPALAASADRIRRIDVAALADALTHAGLEMPPEVRVTLVAEGDANARAVPEWIAGLALGDRDIVIFPERVLSYPYDSIESVVRHEVAHLALNARAGGAPLPRWFHEGVATSVDVGWQTAARIQLLLAMLARPDTAELTRLFVSESRSETARAYLLSALLVNDVRERHGPAVPGAIARRVASGLTFAEAFHAETGQTPDRAADAAWAGYRRWTEWVPAVTSPSAAWAVIVVLALMAFAAQRRRRARRRRHWDDEESTSLSEGELP
jgi:hypothetical protein